MSMHAFNIQKGIEKVDDPLQMNKLFHIFINRFILQIYNNYFRTTISRISMKVLELYVNSFLLESGDIFDFNTQLFEQGPNFKANVFQLALPNPHSHIYYFFHKCVHKYEDKFIQIERKKEFKSNFGASNRNVQIYTLIGGIKLFYRMTEKGKEQLHMTCYSGKDIPIQMGNFETREDALPYMIAKTHKNGVPLKKNQLLRFGRIQYKLVQIESQPDKQQYFESLEQHEILDLDQLYTKSHPNALTTSELENKQTEQKNCRICLFNEEQGNNILIQPCHCSSSIGSMHINCLKHWISVKTSKMKNDDTIGESYHTNLLCCEICKKSLPKVIKLNNEMIPLLNFLDNFRPYLGLEVAQIPTTEKKDRKSEMIYITVDEENKASVGRLLDNGVIIDDITVSRKHAMFEMNKDNKFVLKDTDSKFGTLVYEKDAAIKLSNRMTAFQIKSTVFAAKIIKNEEK